MTDLSDDEVLERLRTGLETETISAIEPTDHQMWRRGRARRHRRQASVAAAGVLAIVASGATVASLMPSTSQESSTNFATTTPAAGSATASSSPTEAQSETSPISALDCGDGKISDFSIYTDGTGRFADPTQAVADYPGTSQGRLAETMTDEPNLVRVTQFVDERAIAVYSVQKYDEKWAVTGVTKCI